jgi:pimeloyl-ACP methyl ester carboxylesterase
MLVRTLALTALIGFAASTAAADEIGVGIPTRPGVSERVLYDAPSEIKAVALLFPGGFGAIGIHGEGAGASADRGSNFLIRSRKLFVAAGVAVVSVDVPSDHESGIDESFRLGEEHGQDVAALVAWVRRQTTAPVWLVGTSMGSISAASTARRLGHEVDGVVLTSSVSRSSRNSPGGGVSAVSVQEVTVPVLVVDHVDEACRSVGSPEQLAARFTGSPRVATVKITGGSAGGDPCGPLSPHGYLDVEDKAVAAITDFMLNKPHP